jgi:hypothetical protein
MPASSMMCGGVWCVVESLFLEERTTCAHNIRHTNNEPMQWWWWRDTENIYYIYYYIIILFLL